MMTPLGGNSPRVSRAGRREFAGRTLRKARRAALVAVLFVAMAGMLGLFAPHLLTAAVSGLTAAVTVVGLGARTGTRRLLALA